MSLFTRVDHDALIAPEFRQHPVRRVVLIVLAVAVVLAAMLAVGVALGRGSARPAATSHLKIATAPAASTPTAPVPAIIPTVNLKGLHWANVDGLQVPVSSTAGPRDTANGLASGYAHTPLGALMAAVNLSPRSDAALGSNIFLPTIEHQVVGSNQPALLAKTNATYAQELASAKPPVTPGSAVFRSFAVINGFRWTSYTPSVAIVHVVESAAGANGQPVYVDARYELRWSVGDWRLVAPPTGNWRAVGNQVTSLTGYTLFPTPPGGA